MNTADRRTELDPNVERMLDIINEYNISLSSEDVGEARQQLQTLISLGTAEPVAVDEVNDITIPGPDGELDARIYRPNDPDGILVFYHGGGFVMGSLDTHDNLCRLIADSAGFVVVSVGYRLAPEHPFPAAVKDAYESLHWVSRNKDRFDAPDYLAVAGDSAGGTLSAVTSLMARDRGMPRIDRQLLLYPATSYLDPMPSRAENGDGYLLTADDLLWFADHYIEDDIDARHPYAFPLQARDLGGLPPALVITCGFDPLRDEGYMYAERLEEAGVEVQHINYPQLIHSFLNMEGIVDRAYDAVDDITTYLHNDRGE